MLALPPETVVPRDVVVPYSNFGVVDVEPAVIVPLNVAELVPIAVGLLVLIETPPTAFAMFDAVQPPDGFTAASSLALCSLRSVAISPSVAPAAFMTS
ncbi:MAG: hypothetical protein RLZ84_978 [Actinomycetota bacterium]